MTGDEEHRELERYTAELERLLAGDDLTPDTRARSIAALIETDALTQAADRVSLAADTTLSDTMPLVLEAVRSFGEVAQTLASALEGFGDPATALTAGLWRLPDR